MATQPIDPDINPIFAGRALTPVLTSTVRPAEPKRRSVPPAVGKIVGELGLRYRPSLRADLEAHAEALRLLVEDVADVPPHLLEAAAKRWVREQPFMPKASELVSLARGRFQEETRGTDAGERHLQAHCDRLNAMAWCRGKWRVTGEAPNRSVTMDG